MGEPQKRKRKRGQMEEEDAALEPAGTPALYDEEEPAATPAEKDYGRDPESYPDDAPAAGVIEEIRLEDFMCHRCLEVKLGPRINFVCGENGSGKSAILTAITIGLGSNAAATNRAKSLKMLVRAPAKQAIIALKLRNRGPDAYKFGLYGPSIYIERKIAREGSSSFRLLDHQKKRVSGERAELDNILEQFNIQVDNPCCILNQDTSRQFLTSADNKVKYKFFLEGTHLAHMLENIGEAREKKDSTALTLSTKESSLRKMEAEVAEHKARYDAIASVVDLKRQIKGEKNQMAWALVEDKERDIAEKSANVEKLRTTIAKSDESMRAIKEKEGIYNEQLMKVSEEAVSVARELDEIDKRAKDAKRSRAQITGSITQLERQKASQDKILKQKQQRKKKAEDRISDIQARNSSHIKQQNDKRTKEVASKQEELEELKKKHAELKRQRQDADAEISKLESEADAKRAAYEKEVAIMKKLERRQKDIDAAEENALAKFGGAPVVRLVDLLARDKRNFHVEPVGPIGYLLTMEDNKWAYAIQCCIKRHCMAWVVTDRHDEQRLKKLMHDAGFRQHPTIFVQKFLDSVYDIPATSLPPRAFTTMLQVVNAEHPMVLNALIDNAHIEQMVLFDTREQAMKAMYPRDEDRNPKNVLCGWDREGGQTTSRNGSRAFIPSDRYPQLLGVNIEEQRRQLKAEMDQNEKEGRAAEKVSREMDTLVKAKRDSVKSNARLLNKQQADINALTQAIQDLTNVQEEVEEDVSELLENVQSIQAEIDAQNNEMRTVDDEIARNQRELPPYEAKVAECEAAADDVRRRGEESRTRFEEMRKEVESIAKQKRQREVVRAKAEEELDPKERELAEATAELGLLERQAVDYCKDRMVVGRTPAQIEKEIKKLQKRLDTEEQKKGDPEVVTREYEQHRDTYRSTERQIKQLQRFLKHLETDVADRTKLCKNYRKCVAVRISDKFVRFLSQKGATGTMVFDHAERTLNIVVAMNNGTDQSTASLSGGERSFTTVAYLLALWNEIRAPFTAMDEFDVFMDCANRVVSVRLLIEAARHQKGKQTIFITPQSMSAIPSGKDIRTYKLQSPDRRPAGASIDQSTLDDHVRPVGGDGAGPTEDP